MKKYLLFLLLLATLVLFAGCQSASIDKPNTEISNSADSADIIDGTDTTDGTDITDQASATQPVEVIQSETFQKTKLNVDEISSVTIKIFTSLNGGPKQKIITDRALISEMVEYWNDVELKNKTERPDPGTTLTVVFHGDVAFSINSGYLGYDGNYYEQPAGLEEQFKQYYVLAKEEETPIAN